MSADWDDTGDRHGGSAGTAGYRDGARTAAEQRQPRVAARTTERGRRSAAEDVRSGTEALADDVDAILDEIDDVLEENAEEFVRGYVQKGGQ